MKFKQQLKKDFSEVFDNKNKLRVFFAPGRLNLIGEHTDSGGYVFPCTLNYGTYGVVRKREDNQIRIYSKNFDSLIEFSLDTIEFDEENEWINYLKGIINKFKNLNYKLGGFDAYIYSNIPEGIGLSKTASLELLTAVFLEKMFKNSIDRIKLCKIANDAVNEFTNCATDIIDQFAIGMGKKNHAILLDSDTLEYKYIPFKLTGVSMVITNTHKEMDNLYEKRYKETEVALETLQDELDISKLSELSVKEFEKNKHLIDDEVTYRRTRHTVSENRRAIKAVNALLDNKLGLFGRFMNESHISLRDDYEVTNKELDTLVSLARPLSLGVRMTRGNESSIVALVKNSRVNEYKEYIKQEYERIIGYQPSFYVATTADGAKEI